LDNSAREFYKVVKKDFKFEEYLIRLSKQDRVYITKLRTSNLKFPIETGRWNNIAKELRLCSFCNKKNWRWISHFIYMFKCQNCSINTKTYSKLLLEPPVIFKMEGLFRLCNTQLMTNISRFIKNLSQLL